MYWRKYDLLEEHSKYKVQLYKLHERMAESNTTEVERLNARKESEKLQAQMFTIEQKHQHILNIIPKY